MGIDPSIQMGVCACGEMSDDEKAAKAAEKEAKEGKKETKKAKKKEKKKLKKQQKQQQEFIATFFKSIELTEEQREHAASLCGASAEGNDIVEKMFEQCDTNKNGHITVDEINATYGAVAEIMLAEFDLDNSKSLTLDEFMSGLRHHYQEHPARTAKFIVFLTQEEQQVANLCERLPEEDDASKQLKADKQAAKQAREEAARASILAAEQMSPEDAEQAEQEAAAISATNNMRSKRVEKVERDTVRANKRSTFSVQSPRKEPGPDMDWSSVDQSKWKVTETSYNGTYRYGTAPVMEEVKGAIAQGRATLQAEPAKYQGMWFQTSMETWPVDQQVYTLVERNKGSEMLITANPGGGFTHLKIKFEALSALAQVKKDNVTDGLTAGGFGGYRLREPLLPGRGHGVADVPTIRLMYDADPSDVTQGRVGDCWLLSAISSLAEFNGAIHKIFQKTFERSQLSVLPEEQSNTYTVTLHDLPSGTAKDLQIDERLCNRADGSGLLGAQPSVSGELWVPYLEKAVAAHCGGWDKIDGGTSTHAWRILTGCEAQYTIKKDARGAFKAYGAYNPNDNKMEDLENSPHDGFSALWPMKWPQVGGGGGMNMGLTSDQLFERMCAWEDAGFMMAAGTKVGSDTNTTDGIVDGHAYSILDVENDVGAGKFDMIKVRNPWGSGEMQNGKWDDDGPGWKEHPHVKAALNPLGIDDGIFWVEKSEFFEYFPSVYLCAMDMSEWTQSE